MVEEYTLEDLVFDAYHLGERQGKGADMKQKVIVLKIFAMIELYKRSQTELTNNHIKAHIDFNKQKDEVQRKQSKKNVR